MSRGEVIDIVLGTTWVIGLFCVAVGFGPDITRWVDYGNDPNWNGFVIFAFVALTIGPFLIVNRYRKWRAGIERRAKQQGEYEAIMRRAGGNRPWE
jgi:hypothetical protein